ncbi:MAG: outer membrane beta-barrel protein [Armatimonadetes bacterium]|nr:outer membrane beta-barrel protein [Armatimonadota bacterium]
MRHPKTTARALGAALTMLGAFAAPAAFAQDQTAPAPANPPGPATQPPPAPGTTQPAPTQPAPQTPGAAPATPPPNYNFQYNGLVDGYYLFNFVNPKDTVIGGGHIYDARNNSPTLELAELNLFQNARPAGLGYKATLQVGDVADTNTFDFEGANQGKGESRYKDVAQLYGTYAFGGGGGVDLGKFFTPFGYEVTESNGNYNYSRSLAYNLVPFYHFGLRAYTPSGVLGVRGLTATGIIARSLFNTAESGVQGGSPQPGIIGQLNYADPGGRLTLIEDLGFGKDKLNASAVTGGGTGTKSTLSDTNFTYNLSSTVLAGLDYVYLYQQPDGNPHVTSTGYAVYFRQQFTPKQAYALRVSGTHTDKNTDVTSYSRPYEFTATYEYKAAANFLTRAEYRHDNADQQGVQPFLGSSLSSARSNQDTISVSGVFTF